MEPNTLVFFLYKSDGSFYRLTKEQGEEEEDVRVIYIPEIDVSIHGNFVGYSPAGIPFRKFVLYLKYYENDLGRKIVDRFTNSGWSISFE